MAHPTNSTEPTGGVTKPIPRLTISMMPNCTTSDQITELFTNYGPIDMLFIDGEGRIPTKTTAWTLQPDCLITRGAIATPEQYVPGQELPECTSPVRLAAS